MHSNAILEVQGLGKSFGGVQAVQDVTFSLAPGGITSMIGPNGAGKSTFVNCLAGLYAPSSGRVFFQGEDITGLPAHKIAYRGVGRTFQLEEPFPSLTVLQNAMVGCHARSRAGMFASSLRLPWTAKEERRLTDEAMANLAMLGLERRAHDLPTNLPLGERKLVGIARALGMKPKFLMLDEPAGGLATHEVNKVVTVIQTLVERGLTLFIIEHNMPFVMSISQRVIALEGGRKIADGTPDEVQKNEEVILAYLGKDEGSATGSAPVNTSRAGAGNAAQLRVESISSFYGPAQALKGVSLTVGDGQVVAVLGSNGAGKTTLLRSINGMIVPRSGKIAFRGEEIRGLHPSSIIRKGLATVAEGGRLFGPMSVQDNLLLGSYPLVKKERRAIVAGRLETLFTAFPVLKMRQKQKAETLSGGERQMLAVARALMSNPRLLVLDEPSLGLSPLLVTEMMNLLKGLSEQMNLSILLVEQNAKAALRIADYAYVLERGEVVLEGKSRDVASDKAIRRAYLGGESETEPPCAEV